MLPGSRSPLKRLGRMVAMTALSAILLTVASPLPAPLAQAPSAVSIYSIWVRLSLRGLNQEEIESLMSNMDPKAIETVKLRLRNTVLSNLEARRIHVRFKQSRDSDDLKMVYRVIETEMRFAGLTNDPELRLMIKDRFGINLERF